MPPKTTCKKMNSTHSNFIERNRPIWQWVLCIISCKLTNKPIWINCFRCILSSCEQKDPLDSDFYILVPLQQTSPFANEFLCVSVPSKQIGPLYEFLFQFCANEHAHMNQLINYYIIQFHVNQRVLWITTSYNSSSMHTNRLFSINYLLWISI